MPQSSAPEKMLDGKDLHPEDQEATLQVSSNSPHSILCSALLCAGPLPHRSKLGSLEHTGKAGASP